MATEIAGLPVGEEPGGLACPLDAVAIIRGLDADGHVKLSPLRTAGMTAADAARLLHVAGHLLHDRGLGSAQ